MELQSAVMSLLDVMVCTARFDMSYGDYLIYKNQTPSIRKTKISFLQNTIAYSASPLPPRGFLTAK